MAHNCVKSNTHAVAYLWDGCKSTMSDIKHKCESLVNEEDSPYGSYIATLERDGQLYLTWTYGNIRVPNGNYVVFDGTSVSSIEPFVFRNEYEKTSTT